MNAGWLPPLAHLDDRGQLDRWVRPLASMRTINCSQQAEGVANYRGRTSVAVFSATTTACSSLNARRVSVRAAD